MTEKIKSAIETLENALKGALLVPSECAFVGTDIISICLETLKDREKILLDAENDAYSRGVLAGIELGKNEYSKAWSEVLNELEEERAFEDSLGNDEAVVELDMCIRIINQKLAEIEERRGKKMIKEILSNEPISVDGILTSVEAIKAEEYERLLSIVSRCIAHNVYNVSEGISLLNEIKEELKNNGEEYEQRTIV